MVDQLNSFASEVTRVAREVGSEGKLGGQARVEGVAGTWADLTDNVNAMAGNLTGQVRNIAEVTTAVASGDLSKKITVEVKGEILELKNTINTMVDQLNSFASEVSRVAREVGSEGKLGGQAKVEGVGGTWKDLTNNVNELAANLTGQRSEEHTSELQSRQYLVCRLLLEKKLPTSSRLSRRFSPLSPAPTPPHPPLSALTTSPISPSFSVSSSTTTSSSPLFNRRPAVSAR